MIERIGKKVSSSSSASGGRAAPDPEEVRALSRLCEPFSPWQAADDSQMFIGMNELELQTIYMEAVNAGGSHGQES
jgi:hypothetical protein